jgi:hypothetical protein
MSCTFFSFSPSTSSYPFWPTLLYTLSVLSVLYVITRILRWMSAKAMGVDMEGQLNKSGEHNWTPGGLFLPLYCSLCGGLLVGSATAGGAGGGGFAGKVSSVSSSSSATNCYLCSDCGLATCLSSKCIGKAEKARKCKQVAWYERKKEKKKERTGPFRGCCLSMISLPGTDQHLPRLTRAPKQSPVLAAAVASATNLPLPSLCTTGCLATSLSCPSAKYASRAAGTPRMTRISDVHGAKGVRQHLFITSY